MDSNSPSTSDTLPRDQLLAALDTEINNYRAVQSSSGHTRWALLLSLSGLIWLGIQICASPMISPPNVAVLAITLTVLWDFVLQVRNSLDSSLLPPESPPGGFIALSHLLGALRSTIVFQAIKQAIILALMIRLAPRQFFLLECYVATNLLITLLVLVVSYKSLPSIPTLDFPSPGQFLMRLHRWFIWLVRVAVACSATFILCRSAVNFSADDVRLGIICTALGYLATLIVAEQFPSSHIAALQAVRRNLAFCRISPSDAKNQIDLLLLAGGRSANTFQHTTDALLAAIDQVRSNYAQIKESVYDHEQLTTEIAQGPENDDLQIKRTECELRHKSLVKMFDDAIARHDVLLKQQEDFENQVKIVGFLSASAAKEINPLIETLKAALVPLAEQRDALKSNFPPPP